MTDFENERCVDPIDQGSNAAAMFTAFDVQRVREKAAPEQVQNADGTWPTTECMDCGDDLESVRLLMGRKRCFACQSHKEKMDARYGRR